MTPEELRQVQLTEKEMLEEVDRICVKRGIHYNMVGGTMLGAIRHGGFIPWDDDADIAMLRDEYEKFVEACKTELDGDRFYFQDIHATDGYRWGYGKLRRKGTAFIRLGQEDMPYEQGIFIDIFPLDIVPDGYIKQHVHKLQCFIMRKRLWSYVGATVEKNWFKRQWYKHWAKIPREKLIEEYDELVKRHRNEKAEMVRILTFPTPQGTCGYYRKWYEDWSYYDFEDIKLQGAKDYEDWLTYKFGNWREIPPDSEQKIHPISYLKLLRGGDRSKKYNVGYMDGTFDMFHTGHLNIIERAKEYCDYLIVAVHGDDVVREMKPNSPVISEEDRRRIVGSLSMVDQAEITRFRDKRKLWDLYHFDVIFIGDDYKGSERWNKFEKDLKEVGADVVYLPYTKTISTTEIRRRVVALNEKVLAHEGN